MENVKSI